MINAIREMINEKHSFNEAAGIILEDALGSNLDDLIVLGEEGETDMSGDNEDIGDMDTGVGMESEDPEGPDTDEEDESDDLMNEPADGSNEPVTPPTPEAPAPEPSPEDDLMSMDANEPPMPLPGDDLPNAGLPTGDPVDDLMNVSVDLRSNTISDTLPVPPSNASEAVPGDDDDLMSMRVDSGFGESAMVLSANKLKGYHIEDIPYLLYTTACKNKNKTPVSKDEFDSNNKFKKLKSDIYASIGDFIRNERLTVVRENVNAVIFDPDMFTEGVRDATFRGWKIEDIPYEIYTINARSEGITSPKSKAEFDKSAAGAILRNKVYEKIAELNKKEIEDRVAKLLGESTGAYSEAISLGDDGDSADDPMASDDAAARSTDGGDGGDTPPDETSSDGENSVTSAVRDKVSEADDMSETDEQFSDPDEAKKELFNKLSAVSRNVEDLKKTVINNMP